MNLAKCGPIVVALTLCLVQTANGQTGRATAPFQKRGPAQGIRPDTCQHKVTKQEGICMFAWHCRLFKGTHLEPCFDGVFVGSCCQLPKDDVTTTEASNEIPPLVQTPSSVAPSEQSNEIVPSIDGHVDKVTSPLVEVSLSTAIPTSTTTQLVPEPITSTSIVTSFPVQEIETVTSEPSIESTTQQYEESTVPVVNSTTVTVATDSPLSLNSVPQDTKTDPVTKPNTTVAKPIYTRVTPRPSAATTASLPIPRPTFISVVAEVENDTLVEVSTDKPLPATTLAPLPRPSSTRRPTTPTRRPTAKPRPTPTRRPTTKRPTTTRRPTRRPTTTRKPTTRRPTPTRRPPPTRRPTGTTTRRPATTIKPTTEGPAHINPITDIPEEDKNQTSNGTSDKPVVSSNPVTEGNDFFSPIFVTTTLPSTNATSVPVTSTTTVATTSAPITTVSAPSATTSVPVTTTNAPVTTINVPVTTTSAPITTTEAVALTTEAIVTSTEAAITATSTELPTTVQPSANTSANASVNAPYKSVCGKPILGPQGRIVGGENAHYAEWPWMISLRQWKKNTFLHKCGAALLNEFWAISAAHCVENVAPTDLLLRLGEYDVNSDKEPEVYVERRVQLVASHPKFDPRTFEYDLALLRFYEPVKFQRNILPICIPDGDEMFEGFSATVTGWGRLYEDGPLPHILQKVQVPVINNKECESMYRKAGFVEDIPDIFICAGKSDGGKDSCEGDSGGPMALKSKGRWALAGIISWGIGCALPNQPGVYTRISKFASWIDQIIAF